MKKQIFLFLLMSFIPWSAWASCSKTNYSDGDFFTAFVPLNGNDSVEVSFCVISEKGKNICVGNYIFNVCAISPSVEGVIIIPSSVNGYNVTAIGHNVFS